MERSLRVEREREGPSWEGLGMPTFGSRVEEDGPAEKVQQRCRWARGVWADRRLFGEGGSGLLHSPPERWMRKQGPLTLATRKLRWPEEDRNGPRAIGKWSRRYRGGLTTSLWPINERLRLKHHVDPAVQFLPSAISGFLFDWQHAARLAN